MASNLRRPVATCLPSVSRWLQTAFEDNEGAIRIETAQLTTTGLPGLHPMAASFSRPSVRVYNVVGQIPRARIQKLSVHIPPAGTVCRPEYLPSCARLTPLIIAAKDSKQMNSRSCPGANGGR